MADESELSRFRQKWREEVTARAQDQVSSCSLSAPQQTPFDQRTKRLSFSQLNVPPALPDHDENNIILESLNNEQAYCSSITRRHSITSKVPRSALEHYENAVEKESEGNLGESLKLYRMAFRMDEDVDKSYKEKHFPRIPLTTAIKSAIKGKEKIRISTKMDTDHSSPTTVPASMNELISSFSNVRITPFCNPSIAQAKEEMTDQAENKFSLLDAVPAEVLLQILLYLAISDIAAFVRLTQVCKGLCYIVSKEEQIWKIICEYTYSTMLWDWEVTVSGLPLVSIQLDTELPLSTFDNPTLGGEESLGRRIIPANEEEVLRYQGSWKEMFHFRPRLRYNGIYISTCNYHRPGGHMGTSLSWGNPVHIVTYYRYIRFYPDGTLLSLLTSHEPSDVVYKFSKTSLTPAHLGGLPVGNPTLSSWSKHVNRGRWRMDPEGCVDIETEAAMMSRYLFRMQLRIKNLRGCGTVKGSGKLNWEGFWSWNKLTDNLAVFEGRNDKPFFFSRVIAVEKEMQLV